MKKATFKMYHTIGLVLLIPAMNLYSQDTKMSVSQDVKFENLLKEKRRVNASITVNDRYKIQIYNGDSESSKKALNEFKKENAEFDATIIFNTPTYKVWIGNFKTRIEAERNLLLLKKKYKNAFLIKPNK
jgi:hypothetical protein